METSGVSVDSLQTITLAFVGDLMCHSTQFNYARVNEDSFDFNPHFEFIKEYLNAVDYTFGNLETVFGGKELGYIGYPNFNSPDDYAVTLKNSGFDFLFTSNNHSLDKGERGALRTLKILDELEIDHTGAFSSSEQHDSIISITKNDFEFAFLSYTYGANGKSVPIGKDYLLNLISLDRIKEDIRKAKRDENVITILYFHFGEEYKREPNDYQKRIVDSAFSYGADVIIGSHPHVLQRSEMRKLSNSILDTGFVAFSLGNFFSNQQWRYSNVGGIVYLTFQKNLKSNRMNISAVNFLPSYVYRGEIDGTKTYRIIPLFEDEDYLTKYPFLTNEDHSNILQAFEDSKKIIGIPIKAR